MDTDAEGGFKPDKGLVNGRTPLEPELILKNETVHSYPLAHLYMDTELIVAPAKEVMMVESLFKARGNLTADPPYELATRYQPPATMTKSPGVKLWKLHEDDGQFRLWLPWVACTELETRSALKERVTDTVLISGSDSKASRTSCAEACAEIGPDTTPLYANWKNPVASSPAK